jgi:hypothetical protein
VIVIVEKKHGFVIVLLRSEETNKQPEFRYLGGRRYVDSHPSKIGGGA